MVVANLLPYRIWQPWVDAAFKKRGIDPEDFWRSAGLPGYRWPDPNGTRFPNGAPPPAPPVLEGTPDHPGPGRGPGSPCSYTPPPELLPRPGNPMPCAGVDQDQGPSGRMGRTRCCPTSHRAAEPRRIAPDAGDPDRRTARAARRPTCRAHRCRSRPDRPGARTEPLGPLPGPAPANPARQHPRHCRPDPRPRRDPAITCLHRSSATQVEPEAAASREVAKIERHL